MERVQWKTGWGCSSGRRDGSRNKSRTSRKKSVSLAVTEIGSTLTQRDWRCVFIFIFSRGQELRVWMSMYKSAFCLEKDLGTWWDIQFDESVICEWIMLSVMTQCFEPWGRRLTNFHYYCGPWSPCFFPLKCMLYDVCMCDTVFH